MDVVRKALTPGAVHVFGASWGSGLMMEWLVTKRPANIASAFFMCPGLDVARAETSRRRAQEQLPAPARQAFADFARTGDASNPALAAAYAEYQRTYIMRRPRPEFPGGAPDAAIMRALGVDLRGWTRVPELKNLTAPVLFMRGEHDYVTAEDVAYYVAARPGAEVVTIPNAGHLAFSDEPEATTEAIRRFLRRIEP